MYSPIHVRAVYSHFLCDVNRDHVSIASREDKRVGHSHHRKTRSRCSIDWTLPPTDILIESHQQLEELQRQDSNSYDPIAKEASSCEKLQGGTEFDTISYPNRSKAKPKNDDDVFKKSFNNSDLSVDKKDTRKMLSSFSDRIIMMGKRQECARWFPYTYEVVIFQWKHLLIEQTKKQSKSKTSRPTKMTGMFALNGNEVSSNDMRSLSDAASNARGVSISCAPILFEIIKKSLGFRILMFFKHEKKKNDNNDATKCQPPSLMTLDTSIFSALEDLISMVTDACIDSRNFDSLGMYIMFSCLKCLHFFTFACILLSKHSVMHHSS